MKKIIVMQFTDSGRQACLEVFEALRISLEDYQIFPDIHDVEEAVETNERQLLVASSFHGIQYQLPAFIQLLRDKNPQLVCVGYCYEKLTGPFDETILATMDYQNRGLKGAIEHFQDVTLNRTSVRYEGRRFSPVHHQDVEYVLGR